MSDVPVEAIERFLAYPCPVLDGPGQRDPTWRDWLRHTLAVLVDDYVGFTGKRPGCNSGWRDYLAAALAHTIDPLIAVRWDDGECDGTVPLPYETDDDRLRVAFAAVLAHILPSPTPA